MAKVKTYGSDFNRNNLDKSSSPYLLQHKGNPIWWQEWSDNLIRYAVKVNKPLFVSVGYATCHWCHVMAAEAFSDNKTAMYMNENFICIKVDREQRPDIDQFMMAFINKQNGRGGWPLNVFLTPELHPVFALTYAPVTTRDSMYSFLSVAEKVHDYFEKNMNAIPQFIPAEDQPTINDESTLVETLSKYYDPVNGGFGRGQKFPSHSTLLYLLYQLSIDDSPSIKTICTKTLDAIYMRGLNDHLQGGIFRYCVDPEWTIPHFEKMLYDQAMALWSFSLAYRVIGNPEYKTMANSIIRCLEESFEVDGLYISAHDADTDHSEGSTYLWSYDELKSVLLPEEFARFSESYYIEKTGNFEGLNHLVRKNGVPLKEIEEKLLSIRKTRKQPSDDDKILSGINALVAIAMIQSDRLLDRSDLERKAASVIRNILDRFWDGKSLAHSSFQKVLQKQPFLSDAGAMLTAISMLFEIDPSWHGLMNDFNLYLESFRENGKWVESKTNDFQTVYASWFDHPFPSGVSLAEMGLTRVALLKGEVIPFKEYRNPFQSDFYNLAAMIGNGLFHIYTTHEFIPWNLLPVNLLQVRGEHEQDCFMGVCSPLDTGSFLSGKTD